MSDQEQQPTLLVICGPTASGKTDLILRLAELAPIEVISADSRQVYRGMDIGTAKPTQQQQQRLRHHLIDVVNPDEPFNAYRFVQKARAAIDAIRNRDSIPVVGGGTGFYIKALVEGSPLGQTEPDSDLRNQLNMEFENEGSEPLIDRLEKLNPSLARSTDLSNPRRLIRALEIAITNRDAPPNANETTSENHSFPSRILCLAVEPTELQHRISNRAQQMFDNGLIDEVRLLVDQGYKSTLAAMSSIGYYEALACAEGTLPYDEAIERTATRTRQLARRQRTWFRHQLPLEWHSVNTALGTAQTHITDAAS